GVIGSDYTDDFVLSVNEDKKFKGYIANAIVYSEVLTLNEIVADAKGVRAGGVSGGVDFLSGETGEYYEYAGIGAFDAFGWKTAQTGDVDVADGFTIAVFGNTQMMLAKAKDGQGRDLYDENYDYTYNVFYKNARWLIDNKDRLNLEFVMHMGNMTDNLNNDFAASKGVKELEYGMSFMDMLTAAGIRWSLNRGNHDGGFDATHTGLYDAGYSYANYAALADGTYNNSDMHSSYYTFEAGGRKYLIISLDLEPTDAELDWANSVIRANADRRVIITTHAYIDADGKLITDTLGGTQNNNGYSVWEKCASKHKNVIMVLCGHANGVNVVKSEKIGENGNKVCQISIDESRMEYFGSRQTGVFALLNFAENGNRINVSYYSASENRFFRSCNQFSVDLDPADYGFEQSKDNLETVILPEINAFGGANGRVDTWGGMYVYEDGDSSLGMNSNNFGINDQSYGYAAAFDIAESGVFCFDDTAYVKTNASSWFYLSVFVIDGNGTAKRWFPKDAYVQVPSANDKQGITLRAKSVEYVIKGEQQQFPLSDIGALSVSRGDKIIVFMQSFGVNYAKFEANLFASSGTIVNYSTGDAFNTASTAASAIITELYNAGYGAYLNGAPVNYNGMTVGWYGTDDTGGTYAPFKYSLTLSDTDDNVIISAVSVKNATYVLPTTERLGKVFVGYEIDGDIYPAGYVLTVDKDITATAVFTGFYMVNGASVRLKEPEGLRFTAHITESDYDYLTAKGLNVVLGTVIVKASDITDGGKVNYGLITTDTEITKVNVLSTVQKREYGNLVFNLALVGISAGGYNDVFAARSYMTITYADGTEKTLYAFAGDNARSVAGTARAALGDVSSVYSARYSVERNGVFSP
ncbi:MAG: metallophosphoesterase, partial [Clostridia bacterium]|nr:metallophosphoesterase [Clostridia bacterium]